MLKIDNTTGMWIFRFIALFCIIFLDVETIAFKTVIFFSVISIVFDMVTLMLRYLDGDFKWQKGE